jgi:hypothetical protein
MQLMAFPFQQSLIFRRASPPFDFDLKWTHKKANNSEMMMPLL